MFFNRFNFDSRIKLKHHYPQHNVYYHDPFLSLDGDYETSSEGVIRGVQEKQVRDIYPTKSRRMDSECDDEAENLKGENSSEDCCHQNNTFVTNVLSKSMPVLKSTSSRENNEEEDKIPMSESSLARHKMMGKIETRIGSLLSSTSNVTRSTDTSRMDIIDESYEPKKQESRTTLPILQVITRPNHHQPDNVSFLHLFHLSHRFLSAYLIITRAYHEVGKKREYSR